MPVETHDRLLKIFDVEDSNDFIEDSLCAYTAEGWVVVSNELRGDKRFVYIELRDL